LIAWIKQLWGRVTSPFYNKMTPEQREEAIIEKMMLHQVNADVKSVNQNIVQEASALKQIPIDKTIYQPEAAVTPPQAPIPSAQPTAPQPPYSTTDPYNVPQHPHPQIHPQIQQIVQQDLGPLIDRVTSLEAQVTKFVNLIERSVAKNAKEINIRIKLNEQNDSTNKE